MQHISKANLRLVLDGDSGLLTRLELTLSDGLTVAAEASLNWSAPGQLGSCQSLLWLEGVGLDSSLLALTDELVADNFSQAPTGFAILLAITIARALAAKQRQELSFLLAEHLGRQVNLPQPIITCFSGGRFGGTKLDFDEFLILPALNNASSLAEKMAALAKVRRAIGSILQRSGLDTDLGVLGAYAPDLFSAVRALEIMTAAIIESGVAPDQYCLGVNVGAWHLWDPEAKRYLIGSDQHHLSALDLSAVYQDWQLKYNLAYLENLGSFEDEELWSKVGRQADGRLIIASSQPTETTATGQLVFSRHLSAAVVNPLIFDSWQEFCRFVAKADKLRLTLVMAATPTDGADDWLVDLAAASGCRFLKAGGLARAEHTAKYNRLVSLEAGWADKF